MSKISIGIVTYNNKNIISNLLESIQQCDIDKLSVYVLDNNSNDNTAEFVEKNYGFITVIRSKENLGYGRGHNKIIDLIDSDYHMIINPDIIVNKEEINKMIYFMDINEDVAILTPKVLNVDGTEQFLPKKRPNIKYLLGRYEKKCRMCKKWRDEYTLRNEKIINPIEIDFCTGCFMFCKTSLLKKINGFDENYFMYFEDVDLTQMIKKVGKTVYNPNITVTHKWSREDSKNNKLRIEHIKSMFKYFKKWS